MALHIETALAFDTPESREVSDQLAQEAAFCAGMVAWDIPADINYILTDEDLIHLASRYRCLPAAAPVRVVMLGWRDTTGAPQARRDMLRRWRELKAAHGVKGRVDQSDLRPFAAMFREVIIEMEREEAATVACNAQRSQSSWDNHRRAVREHGDFVGRRQREAAAQRAEQVTEAPVFQIDWYNLGHWQAPGPNGETILWPIAQMADQHLWETINWIVRNHRGLFEQYQPNARIPHTVSLSAKHWLRVQPVFRGLVQEAISRRLTFPKDVYRYLHDYVVDRTSKTEIQQAVPWRDPEASYQTNELSSFLAEEVDIPRPVDPVREFGREFRDIQLD